MFKYEICLGEVAELLKREGWASMNNFLDVDSYDDREVYHPGFTVNDILKMQLDVLDVTEEELQYPRSIAKALEGAERSAIAAAMRDARVDAIDQVLSNEFGNSNVQIDGDSVHLKSELEYREVIETIRSLKLKCLDKIHPRFCEVFDENYFHDLLAKYIKDEDPRHASGGILT